MIIKTPNTNSQNYKVLEYLKDGNTLTCLEAMQMGFTHNLRSRIADLKRMGYDIQVQHQRTKHSYIAVYSLDVSIKDLTNRLYEAGKIDFTQLNGATLTTVDKDVIELKDILQSEYEIKIAIQEVRHGGYICPF